jgi:hypothetical protein
MIAAAQAQADAGLGAMLPNVSGYLNGRNHTVNFTALGGPQDRRVLLGLKGGATDPFKAHDAWASLAANIDVTNARTSVPRACDNQIEALLRFHASRINLARAKGQIEKIV